MSAQSRSERVRDAIDRYSARITAVSLLAAVAITVVGSFIQPVQEFVMQKHVFEVFILALLLEVVSRLAELRQAKKVQFHPDQDSSMRELLARVREQRPRQAKLLENSTISIRELISCLASTGTETKVLMHDPYRNCVSDIQRGVTELQIITLAQGSLGGTRDLQLRFYSAPAAVRGRHIGSLINIGWYNYFYPDGKLDLLGSQNPMILADVGEVPELAAFFDSAFDKLWDNSLSLAQMVAHSSRYARALEKRLQSFPEFYNTSQPGSSLPAVP